MYFEYDKRKSSANFTKHGIDFEDVQELWFTNMLIYNVRSKGEGRTLGIGRIQGQYWTVVFMQEDEFVRIISARRSTACERSNYDRHINS